MEASQWIALGVGLVLGGSVGVILMAIISVGARSEGPCAKCDIAADPEADRAYCMDCPAVKMTKVGA